MSNPNTAGFVAAMEAAAKANRIEMAFLGVPSGNRLDPGFEIYHIGMDLESRWRREKEFAGMMEQLSGSLNRHTETPDR